MALSTYAELQTAILLELKRGGDSDLSGSVPDMIRLAEAKMNRRLRLREMETQAVITYSAGSSTRRIPVPGGSLLMLEMLDIWIKPSTAADSDYRVLKQVPPFNLPRYYGTSDVVAYAWRNDIEFNAAPAADHLVKMHYIKALDLAMDSTNWVLTHFPDSYLYGALVECELFNINDVRVPVWKTLFDEAIEEMNRLDQRSRNDAVLDNWQTAAMASGRGSYRILKDG